MDSRLNFTSRACYVLLEAGDDGCGGKHGVSAFDGTETSKKRAKKIVPHSSNEKHTRGRQTDSKK